MEFLAQIELDNPLVLSHKYKMAYVFMCPGTFDTKGWLICETWLPFSGANAVVLQSDNNNRLISDVAARYPDYEVSFHLAKEKHSSNKSEDFPSESTKLGGIPAWIQNDETPVCPACGKRMRFIAQLDAALDGDLSTEPSQWENHNFLEFGDAGLGYLFICEDECQGGVAFLWQTT